MKPEADYKYVTINLSTIRRIYTHPQSAFNDLFDIGIHSIAEKLKPTLEESVKQVLYCYYREYRDLTEDLKAMFQYLEDNQMFHPNLGYSGFNKNGFCPDEDIALLIIFIDKNQQYKEPVINFNKVRSVKGILNMTYNTAIVMENINRLSRYRIPHDPLILVKTEHLFDYLKKKKTQYEIDMFSCYLGIRSIIGNSEFSYTTKKYIACRMIGVKSPQYLKEVLKDKKLKSVYEKYAKRYHMDKMLNELVDRKFIVKLPIAQLRRIYISTKLNLQDLSDGISKSFIAGKKQRIQNTKLEEKYEAKKVMNKLKKIMD